MSTKTTYFDLTKPAKADGVQVSVYNGNLDTVDSEMHKPPLTVNGISPDSTSRNLTITEVPLAGNLSSDVAQIVTGAFIQRASGNGSSVGDGSAYINSIQGNMTHTGVVEESIEMTVNSESITATLNRATFVAYVTESGTTTLTYTTSWSANPATYGVTVTGTPANGDSIVIVYVKEDRGTITPATPDSFNATGWNLFNRTAGYARVVRYSEEYGYKIGGSYTLVDFAETLSGARTAVEVENGFFNVPADGYVFVTGSDTTTYIYATWTDWTSGYVGDFESYTVDTIDLSEAMLAFPDGLCAIGLVRDELNINTQTAIQRIARIEYTAENMAAIIASGAQYDADTSYIYYVLAEPVTTSIDLDGDFVCNDHGIEFFTGTDVAVNTSILYGENLKDKLRTDVLTISAQTLDATQKAQVLSNIGAAPVSVVTEKLGYVQLTSVSSNSSRTYTMTTDTKAVFIAFGSTAGTKGLWIVNLGGTSVTIKDLAEAANLTMTSAGSGSVTIANNANVGTRVYAVVFAGSVTDAAT